MTMQLTVHRSSKSPDGVWAFFESIRDVNNLNPAEEQGEAWECIVDDNVAGMVVVDTFPRDHVHIDRIAVDKSFRNIGVGQKLVQTLTEKYNKLQCEIHVDNTASKALFESVGFEPVGSNRYDNLITYEYSM